MLIHYKEFANLIMPSTTGEIETILLTLQNVYNKITTYTIRNNTRQGKCNVHGRLKKIVNEYRLLPVSVIGLNWLFKLKKL